LYSTYDPSIYYLGQGKEYDIGTMANLKQIFGKNWKFCWLLPWLPSHLYTDGTRFLTVNSYEEIKDLWVTRLSQ